MLDIQTLNINYVLKKTKTLCWYFKIELQTDGSCIYDFFSDLKKV